MSATGDYAVIAIGVAIVAFAVRFAWALWVQSPLGAVYSDMGSYVHRADELLGRAPSYDARSLAFYPWGAHVLMAGELSIVGRTSAVGIAIGHALVGAIPAPCVALIVARFVRARLWVLVGGLAAALWHPLITFSGFFMSEVWFTAAIMLASWLVARHLEGRSGSFAAGCAIAVAFVVRPQALLTCALVVAALAPAALRTLRARRPFRVRRLAALGAPVAAMLVFSMVRFHHLTGHLGLVSENGPLNQLFGDTDVAMVEAHWTCSEGRPCAAWYALGHRAPFTPQNSVRWDGYIGDAAMLDKIRLDILKKQTFGQRVRRHVSNARYLVTDTTLFPEGEFSKVAFRRKLQHLFLNVLKVVLSLAAVGLLGMATTRRPRGYVATIIFANVATLVVVCAVYFAEMRFRVPYDPFLIVAATVGLSMIVDRVVRASCSYFRQRPALR